MSETTDTSTTMSVSVSVGVGEPDTAGALRAWAAGMYGAEAGVELLIRAQDGRHAQRGCPWVRTEDDGTVWIDAERLIDGTGVMSGGERRLVAVACSLLADRAPKVALSEVAGLERDVVDLVLAAIAHAAGTHERQTHVVVDGDDAVVTVHCGSLHPWPAR